MRNTQKNASLLKAIAGLLLFFCIDIIGLTIFEAPFFFASLIAYGAILTMPGNILLQLFAAIIVLLDAFLHEHQINIFVIILVGFWFGVFLLKRFVNFNYIVRSIMIITMAFCAQPQGWSVLKIVGNGLLLVSALLFFSDEHRKGIKRH